MATRTSTPRLKRLDLGRLADAAENAGVAEARVGAVGREARVDLGGELARGSDDEGAAAARGGLDGHGREPLDDRQREGGCLSGAGLRAAQKVAPREEGRYRGALYRCRFFVALALQGRQDGLGEAERGEALVVHVNPYKEEMGQVPGQGGLYPIQRHRSRPRFTDRERGPIRADTKIRDRLEKNIPRKDPSRLVRFLEVLRICAKSPKYVLPSPNPPVPLPSGARIGSDGHGSCRRRLREAARSGRREEARGPAR